jgi:integrase
MGYKSGLKKVGDVYYYKFKLNEKTYHGSTGLSDRDAAMQFQLTLKEKLKGDKSAMPTFSEVASMYLRTKVEKAPKYLKRYRYSTFRWLNPLIGAMPIDKVSLEEYARIKSNYLDTPSPFGKPHNDGGLRTILIDFRTTMNFAVTAEIIQKLPFKIQLNTVQEKPIKALVASQAVPFLNAVDSLTRSEQVRLAIRIMLLLGLRISEVTGMRWYWFSSDFKSYTPGLTKGKEADALPVPESLANRFREYKEQTRKHWLLTGRPMPQCVFWTDEGSDRSPSFVASTIANAAKAIGLEGSWRPHRLRASCATILAQLGVSAHHIMRLLRHKKLETTLRYVRAALEELRPSQARIADLVEGIEVAARGAALGRSPLAMSASLPELSCAPQTVIELHSSFASQVGEMPLGAGAMVAGTDLMLGLDSGVGSSLQGPDAGQKMRAVARLLLGEQLDSVALELSVAPSTLLGWKEAFLANGQAAFQ